MEVKKMENDTQEDIRIENTFILKEGKTTEDFQKFFYELFERNGVLNDLRAYLRGHIINILKCVEKGDTPMCQKHFMQRLEVIYQAINMLVAEYLLRMDFTYSLSVFISEIPLANMIFDFAKSLLGCQPDKLSQQLRFQDKDVWGILNYMGIKCDSESAANIVTMYRKEESPLLLCILKGITLYKHESENLGEATNLQVSASSDTSETHLNSAAIGLETLACKHIAFCSTCKQKIKGFQMEYKKKKRKLKKGFKTSDTNVVSIQKFLSDVDITERRIIKEMFEELKTVYEAEVEMVREEEERKIKRSLANHALLLQKRYDEMEESFKARETELECSVQQKKKFLWGLARSLREQHSNMSDAMRAVQKETERLTSKEDSLKRQISEAEQTLRKKGDEMREQISTELIILDKRLSSMKRERDELDKEKSELEKLKEICSANTKIAIDNMKELEILSTRYDLLKEELVALKKCLTTPKIEKCLIERAVMTDTKCRLNSMNNEQEKSVKNDDTIRTPNQLVNDLKKKKNVNFNPEILEEIIPDRNRDRHLEMLQQENERLKAFVDQQHRHIEQLSRDRLLLQSQLGVGTTPVCRPRTAPPAMPSPIGVNPSSAGFESGILKGGGEELTMFPSPTRLMVPGDELPFVGVLPDRRTDTKRHLIKQWRSLRRRLGTEEGAAPQAGTSRQVNEAETEIPRPIQPQVVMPVNVTLEQPQRDENIGTKQQPDPTAELKKSRVKSPKSVLREAKQKLRNKDRTKRQPDIARDKSPNTMLKEAKLRLRKLEIEAEAVERSYLDFRRRQSQMNNDDVMVKESMQSLENTARSLDVNRSSLFKKNHQLETKTSDYNVYSKGTEDIITKDFEKYLKEYQSKQNMESHYNTKSGKPIKTKPIPSTYSKITEDLEKARQSINYLETPLTEFRKLYRNDEPTKLKPENVKIKTDSLIVHAVKENSNSNQSQTDFENVNTIESLSKGVGEENKLPNKENLEEVNSKELKILKKHSEISKPSSNQILTTEEIYKLDKESYRTFKDDDKNLLKVEIENVTETNSVNINEKDGFSVIIESSVDTDFHKVNQKNLMTVVISPRANSSHSSNVNIDKIQNIDESKDKSQDDSPKSLSSASKSSKKFNMTKQDGVNDKHDKSKSPLLENDANLTNLSNNNVLDASLDTKTSNHQPGIQIDLESSKDEVNSSIEAIKEYPDDFSADVDNYDSLSELENSPISLPKTSEEDNFWD